MNNNFNISDPIENEVAEYLFDYHKGIEHSITNKRLADRFQLNERTLRQIITKLIVVNLIPIGSCSTNHSGIFYINDDTDFKIASDELMSRIRKLSKRHKSLRIGYYKGIENKQLSLSGVG